MATQFHPLVSGMASLLSLGNLSSDPFMALDWSSNPNSATKSQESRQETQVPATDPLFDQSEYTSRVEFGLKLGYSESQVQTALIRIGPRSDQNELLAELIKLGATNPCTNNPCINNPCSNYDPDLDIKSTLSRDTQPVPSASASSANSLKQATSCLRPIVIDGSNVAMSHGNKEVFSCRGLRICVDWFKQRGHSDIKVVVPMFRKEPSRPEAPISDQDVLYELEKENHLTWTPSRSVGGRRVTCYDDRYILDIASQNDGIVVSNDNYRDLVNERPEFKKVVEDRLLMYTFANDRFMPPDDPLGRKGPSLDNFLRMKPKVTEIQSGRPCPYDKKCTYGNKCKYYHPERGNQPQKTVTQKLIENAKIPLQEVKARASGREGGGNEKVKATHTASLPPTLHVSDYSKQRKKELSRTKSVIPAPVSMSHHPHVPSAQDPLFWRQNSLTGYPGASIPQRFASNSCANLYSDPFHDPIDHSFITKRLSDPEKGTVAATTVAATTVAASADQFFSPPPRFPSQNESCVDSSNLHRKLQRQLTLNPAGDNRLNSGLSYRERGQGTDGGCQSRLQPIGSHRHQPASRLMSEPQSTLLQGEDQEDLHRQLYNPFLGTGDSVHPNVSRIASAPDSHLNWPSSQSTDPSTARLNSSSDSRLHLTPSPPNFSSIRGPVAPFPGDSIWSPASPSLYGNNWSQPPGVRPSNQEKRDATFSGPLGAASPPRSMKPDPTSLYQTPPSAKSERDKLYFHLSSIFPEEQVRTVMEMNPEETNPQRICAAILNMFPKG